MHYIHIFMVQNGQAMDTDTEFRALSIYTKITGSSYMRTVPVYKEYYSCVVWIRLIFPDLVMHMRIIKMIGTIKIECLYIFILTDLCYQGYHHTIKQHMV